jgi:hypothetical protein
MIIVRTLFAALIAISIAVVPAAAEASFSTKPVEMSMPDNADMPCCPCCNDQDNSKRLLACVLKCINLVGAVLPAMAAIQRHLVEATPPSDVKDALHEYSTSPPTHPPPV